MEPFVVWVYGQNQKMTPEFPENLPGLVRLPPWPRPDAGRGNPDPIPPSTDLMEEENSAMCLGCGWNREECDTGANLNRARAEEHAALSGHTVEIRTERRSRVYGSVDPGEDEDG